MGEDESDLSQSIIDVALRLRMERLAPQPGTGVLVSLRHDLIIARLSNDAV
jgi:hypothetical protein